MLCLTWQRTRQTSLCYNGNMERRWEIYTLTDPRTVKVRYVGVTFRGKQRLNEHLSRAVTGGKTHRDCWIRSLITVGLRPLYATVEQGQGEGWQEAERRWIALLRQTCDLVNLTDGGDGAPGYSPTPELREKWSKMRKGVPYPPGRIPAMKGKRHTPEAIEKIRAASMGRMMPDSMRTALSALKAGRPLPASALEASLRVRLGKPLSESHRSKIAATTTNRKPVACVETGETFPSITALSRTLGVTETSVNQAIRKGCRCKGLRYRFL